MAIIDLDPQETAPRWARRPPRACLPGPRFIWAGRCACPDIKAAGRDADVILLDCPPSIEHAATLASLQAADVALVPVVPSPAGSVVHQGRRAADPAGSGRAERAKGGAGAQPGCAPIWPGTCRGDARFTLPVLGAALSQRNAFAQSAVVGGTVYQLGGPAARLRVKWTNWLWKSETDRIKHEQQNPVGAAFDFAAGERSAQTRLPDPDARRGASGPAPAEAVEVAPAVDAVASEPAPVVEARPVAEAPVKAEKPKAPPSPRPSPLPNWPRRLRRKP